MFSKIQVISRLKARARFLAQTNGKVSAKDIRNVMRSHVEGHQRGGLITKVLNDLVSEGLLSRSTSKVLNPGTKNKCFVYNLV